jgi:hypothetical protein
MVQNRANQRNYTQGLNLYAEEKSLVSLEPQILSTVFTEMVDWRLGGGRS